MANLRRVLTLTLRERKALVKDMSDRDWVNEWMFCLRCVRVISAAGAAGGDRVCARMTADTSTRSLKNKEKSVSSRRRRLKRLYSVRVCL